MEFFQRVVHLDLKGAPPRVEFLIKVLQLCKVWDATGILLEWEDTFPYSSSLRNIGSQAPTNGDGLYTFEDVQAIFRMAKHLNLEVIQLVQTIGHMEFVLKHLEFQHLREVPLFPSVLCPSKDQSQNLVRDMLDQALAVQPDAKYFHIGADEIWHVCICEDCVIKKGSHPHGIVSLYLEHIKNLAIYVHERRPNIKVLIWDDMLRRIPADILQEYNLSDYVQPVVWNYCEKQTFQLPEGLWSRYKEVFPTVWAGSAFKGAASSRQMLMPTDRYLSNHEAWIREITTNASDIKFAGIILTGWSRFDHFATFCELLPLALPCLSLCLKMLKGNVQFQQDQHSISASEWPGHELSQAVTKFAILREQCVSFLHGDMIGTWLNPWQIQHGYTNPLQVKGLALTAQELLVEMLSIEREVRTQLSSVTGPRSTVEWVGTNVMPLLGQLKQISEQAQERAVSQPGVYPVI